MDAPNRTREASPSVSALSAYGMARSTIEGNCLMTPLICQTAPKSDISPTNAADRAARAELGRHPALWPARRNDAASMDRYRNGCPGATHQYETSGLDTYSIASAPPCPERVRRPQSAHASLPTSGGGHCSTGAAIARGIIQSVHALAAGTAPK